MRGDSRIAAASSSTSDNSRGTFTRVDVIRTVAGRKDGWRNSVNCYFIEPWLPMEHCGCQRAYSAELPAFEGVEVPFVIQDSIDPVGEELYPKEKIRIMQLRSVAKVAYAPKPPACHNPCKSGWCASATVRGYGASATH